MSLKSIQAKIVSVKKTNKVTKAMEAVSAVKMRKAQARALEGRPYALHALSILRRIMGSTMHTAHPLTRENGASGALVVLITSDKGLAGALSGNVIKGALRTIERAGIAREQVQFLTIGKKGFEHVSKRGFAVEENIVLKEGEVSLEAIERITVTIMRRYEEGAFGRVYLAYTHFGSTMMQEPLVREIVPIRVEDLGEMIAAIVPERGKFAEMKNHEQPAGAVDYIFEPSAAAILGELVPFLLSIEVYHALMESLASEHSARMVAMKNASGKAEEVGEDLTRLFNRQRQAAITREVSEIVGGVEAMK